jgi:DNA-binding GntR family transcriptional regulator
VNATITPPRHQEIYATLRSEIASGAYNIGALIPTEEELRKTHGVTRYALREALRHLEEEGMIARRRGAGTRVISRTPVNTFRHMAGSHSELLAYSQSTKVVWEKPEAIRADGKLARLLGCDELREWYLLRGIRYEEHGDPIGVVYLYIDATRVTLSEDVDFGGRAVYEWLRDHFDLKAHGLSQDISARRLTMEEARSLNDVPGNCGLQIIRRYFDPGNSIFEISVNIHRSQDFVYNMRVQLRDS